MPRCNKLPKPAAYKLILLFIINFTNKISNITCLSFRKCNKPKLILFCSNLLISCDFAFILLSNTDFCLKLYLRVVYADFSDTMQLLCTLYNHIHKIMKNTYVYIPMCINTYIKNKGNSHSNMLAYLLLIKG